MTAVASSALEGLDSSLSSPWPQLIGRFLELRGLSKDQDIEKWLYPKLSDLADPSRMLGMRVAVDRLIEAYRRREKICIYADFDLDGTSGLALLWTALRDFGFAEVLRYQPKRLSEGYGFHASAVEDLHRQGVSLIVTVDVGITAFAACDKARELGLDVIITDHHLPAGKNPDALAVVNPNQTGDDSGQGDLCGAGVAFFLVRALLRRFHEQEDLPKISFDLKSILDFFTIATLTDMVPLRGDNRVLVKHGLHVLSDTKRPGLRALLEALDLADRPLTSQDVAIRFAPKLNALSRMESGVLPIDLMLCESPSEAAGLVAHVLENNSTRVQLQADAEQLAFQMLENWPHEEFVFVHSAEFHRGVVGLIATKLAQQMNRPAFVGSLNEEEGVIVGSARLPGGSEACLVEALGAGGEHLARFGGHSAAAGFEVHRPQVPALLEKLAGHFRSLKEKPRPMEIVYDLELSFRDLNAHLMKWYDFVGPFGAGFSVPLFKFSQVQLQNVKELRGGHLKLVLNQAQAESNMEALLFSPTERQKQLVQQKAESYDLLGELQWNYFAGAKKLQILIRDLKTRTWQ